MADQAAQGNRGDVTERPAGRLQQAVARRAAEARATVPHVDLEAEADVEAALAATGETVGLVHVAVKAFATALAEHPVANGSWRGDGVERFGRVNVALAVLLDDAVVLPVLHDADRAPLAALAARAGELEAEARAGTILAPALAGATASLWDLGAHGVERSAPIVAPGQLCALGLGAPRERPVVRDGGVVVRRTAWLSLACDHRALFGVGAAALLDRVRALLEDPAALLQA
ncbi:2-oxo acid dehydrogenase subunit E2 [Conexibacter sp. SYSU D00693]|uniref:2-oxo acid dehydrogenase subunit E2 n=1 Tax=Conexibacter sp. SYSU D00693 TaxID=2812560 RepID=UPI00196A60EA|nr:2-oxo acid dehydrogenase subunit E2 [Conexibacter sp. SYSU D00693]